MPKKFEVFISYRRKGGYDTAKLLYDRLRLDGYSVSFDIDTLVNGNFDSELEQRVNDCKDFLLVLSPGIFDKFFESDPDYDPENDWVRREITHAIKTSKNIIPLVLDGFVFPKTMPNDVKDVTRKNAIDLYPKYFEAAYDKMKSFLTSKPSWIVKHKKKIFAFASIAFLIFATFSYLTISKLQEAQKASEEERKAIAERREQWREQRQREKIFHWNGPDDAIGQVIFEKIAEIGIEKTECTGNGIIAGINDVNCRGTTEITCFYVPRITFANCDNRPITFLEKKERFRTGPQASEAAAKEELANKLRDADFSDWVSEMKKLK